ncbi:MAG: hypothetical protein KKA90_03100 [Nanoarchaeota archaeon]|nr:hypothetical protein [Nanoarchaeota archaeon]
MLEFFVYLFTVVGIISTAIYVLHRKEINAALKKPQVPQGSTTPATPKAPEDPMTKLTETLEQVVKRVETLEATAKNPKSTGGGGS